MRHSVVLMLGPHRDALSGISTHLNQLFSSRLAEEFNLVHFQVGSEGRKENAVSRLARLLMSPLLLALTILVHRAAIVHINTAFNARAYWRDLLYLIVAKMLRRPVLYQVHGGALPQQFFGSNPIPNVFLRTSLRLADAVAVLARAEFEAYRQFVPRQRILLLPNCVDCAAYAKLARVRPDASTPLRLVYIGRLAEGKGLRETLLALKLARTRGANVRLVIAGSGPEAHRLAALGADLGIAGALTFAGPVYGESKTELLAGADALVLASYSEGLPYALLESMAAGVPAIVSGVGAIPDVVTDGVDGLIVPPRDVRALALALCRLACDRDLLGRMSAACRRRIADAYSIDQAVEKLSRIYSSLMNREFGPDGNSGLRRILDRRGVL